MYTKAIESDYLRSGRDLVCSGYVLYGPATMMVIAVPGHVYIFTYDFTIGEFILTQQDVKIPDGCKYYSVNEGNWSYWQQADKDLIEYFKSIDKTSKRPIAARYVGSLVAGMSSNVLECSFVQISTVAYVTLESSCTPKTTKIRR